METICTECQITFPCKNMRSITSLSSAELAQELVKVNETGFSFGNDNGHEVSIFRVLQTRLNAFGVIAIDKFLPVLSQF